MTIDFVALDDIHTFVFDGGRVRVLRGETVIATNPLASKALVGAAFEIEHLREHAGESLRAPAPVPGGMLRVDLENGKYTLLQTVWGVGMLRYSAAWLDEDQLGQSDVWLAVGRELQRLRQHHAPACARCA